MSSRTQAILLTPEEVEDLCSKRRLPPFIKVVEILGRPNDDGAKVFLAFIVLGSQKTFVLLQIGRDGSRKSEGFNWPKSATEERLQVTTVDFQVDQEFVLAVTNEFAPHTWR